MDKEEPHFGWWPFFRQYAAELTALAKWEYENSRNAYSRQIKKRFPKACCMTYSVNAKRYDDAIWMQLLKQCYVNAIEPRVAFDYLRSHYADRMPWPDVLWRAIQKDAQFIELDSRNGTISYLSMLVKLDDEDRAGSCS